MLPIKGAFKNATATSVEGNSKLCGGIPEFHLPKCKLQHAKKKGLSLTMKLVLSLVCGILGVIFALTFLYLYCSRRDKKGQAASDSDKFPQVSYQSLLKATNGFSSTNLVGMGSFGSVYKGILEQAETTVAIKVLNLVRRGAYKSFIAECETFKNIRHRNLVKVLSACSGFDYHGHDFKALIYEFMVNGSLEEWLYPIHTIGETNERPRSLTISQRLNIVIDVVMALDYLHHHCETPIVHCDLKPSNILLNEDMVAHVGDFRLVRFLPKAAENSSGNQSSSLRIKGTISYAPPVWTQGDVYSFGILLGTSNLYSFVKAALPEQVEEVLDPGLVQESNHPNEERARNRVLIIESLISVLEIGVACSAKLPRERLNICDAVAHMFAIKVLNLVRRGAYKSFIAECKAFRNIRHRNLVKVLSACSGFDYRGHDFKALIYEFMVNRSLEEWLYPIHTIAELPRERLNIYDAVAHMCQIRNKLRANGICE
ncbi:LRR receptor-like serine/threonine-protein kinase [Pyrus ussuriensis x Pyrus communis]|uniref:LRR receptor-like serine/threonine-protein kinase n=1 Tax=Pyrus ussuriensis x Pyrus communis TaxID=2448454 RepID=A0A5N5GGD5_9ROSA|nr:LRR receptor-like serine/threonine-protein kinase [Pyrus ussuriensis x Pyrus communis]